MFPLLLLAVVLLVWISSMIARRTSLKSHEQQLLLLGVLIGTIPSFIFIGRSPSAYNQGFPTTTTTIITTRGVAEHSATAIPDRNVTMPLYLNTSSVLEIKEPEGPHLKWCPRANCTDTDLCHPCQRRFLIVIATGRSASTTLTWMLNELPGIRMSGENNNQLNALLEMKENIWNRGEFRYGSEKKNAWGHNYIPEQTFACSAQSMLQTINPPKLVDNKFLSDKESEKNDIVGFKTIRFDRGGPGEFLKMVTFVTENFPCSRVIVNINSNSTRQMESAKKVNFTEVDSYSYEQHQQRNEIMKKIHGSFGKQAFLLDSEKWTQDVSVLNEVVDWLGFHPTCRFEELLRYNTGGNGYGNEKDKLSWRSKKCVKI